ncbi:MAG: NAD(P)-dependent oxidoreductase, partial [Alphaproteobacteria bacterium]|nr:NAD(P)-dependent oxidoreductase [Alphaproteobacteria bacterium]
MAKMKPKIILTRKLSDSVETRMRELFDAELSSDDQPLSAEQLVEVMQRADVLVPTVTDKIDAGMLEQVGANLKLIASFGTGVDHIDLHAAKAKGVTVTNTPGVLTEDTADVAMALILSVPRRIMEGDVCARSGEWTGWSPTGMLGHRINGKRLGIIGMG